MSLGGVVEQAITNQVLGLAIVALVVGIVIGAIAMMVVRRGRSNR